MNVFEFLKYSVEEEHKAIDKILDNMKEEELQYSLGDNQTIASRLKHICGAEFRMAAYLYSKGYESINLEVTTLVKIKDAFIISKERHLETLDNLTLDDLDKDWHSKVSGNTYSYKFLLWHFIEHIATHRGQIAMALRLSRENINK